MLESCYGLEKIQNYKGCILWSSTIFDAFEEKYNSIEFAGHGFEWIVKLQVLKLGKLTCLPIGKLGCGPERELNIPDLRTI